MKSLLVENVLERLERFLLVLKVVFVHLVGVIDSEDVFDLKLLLLVLRCLLGLVETVLCLLEERLDLGRAYARSAVLDQK